MTTVAQTEHITQLYSDQAAARTAQQTWRDAVQTEAAKAHAALPHLTERLQAAQTLVLDGAVALGLEGHATVRSCSDAGVFYEVNGVCSCKDAQHGAPDGLCKHRLAVGLVKRATKHLQAPVVVEDAAPRRCPTCFLVLEDGEMDCSCAHEAPAQSALPQAVAVSCPEAMFSLCVRGKIGGQDAQLTVRAQDITTFTTNVAAVRGMFDAPQASATSSPEYSNGAARSAGAERSAREERCTLHDVPMVFNEPTQGGRGWYSHRTDDERFASGFCKGRLGKQAQR